MINLRIKRNFEMGSLLFKEGENAEISFRDDEHIYVGNDSCLIKYKHAHLLFEGFYPYEGDDDISPLGNVSYSREGGTYDHEDCSFWWAIKDK